MENKKLMKTMKNMVWCQWVLLSIDSSFSRSNIFIKIIFGEKNGKVYRCYREKMDKGIKAWSRKYNRVE